MKNLKTIAITVILSCFTQLNGMGNDYIPPTMATDATPIIRALNAQIAELKAQLSDLISKSDFKDTVIKGMQEHMANSHSKMNDKDALLFNQNIEIQKTLNELTQLQSKNLESERNLIKTNQKFMVFSGISILSSIIITACVCNSSIPSKFKKAYHSIINKFKKTKLYSKKNAKK